MPMKTKTKKRGRLAIAVNFPVDAGVIARCIAFDAQRQSDGGYVAPDWATTRRQIERNVARLLSLWGSGFFAGDRDSWCDEFPIPDISVALKTARRVVRKHFPEL